MNLNMASASGTATSDKLLFGKPFNSRKNSLNLLRLVLASSVLFHHSFPLLGLGYGPPIFNEGIGGWAVIGFFALSGYLITASRKSKSFGDYLTLRIARIYPAFITCLLATVVIFAPLNWIVKKGSISGYLNPDAHPANFIINNLSLKMWQYDVGGGPFGVPAGGSWNGSLWSLYYEFICYIIIGLLLISPWARKSPIPILALWAISVIIKVQLGVTTHLLGWSVDVVQLARLLPYFMAGAVLQVLKNRIGMNGWVALGSAGTFIALLFVNEQWGGQVGSLFLTYTLLYLGNVLPCPRLIQTQDISYGIYIYAWPSQQTIVTLLPGVGYWRMSLLALGLTVVFAILSWLLIEKPILQRARDSLAPKPS